MRKDVVWSEYFEDNERVADLINGYVCNGKEEVHAEDIKEVDNKLTFRINERLKLTQKTLLRDVVRKVAFGTTFLILDMENQSIVDYSYPLRELGYIYGEYEKQHRKIRRILRKSKSCRNISENMYGYGKEDKMHPTIVFLLYSGKDEWDGPLSLHDMLDMKGVPESIRDKILDLNINLINIREMSEESLNSFKTDIKNVFRLIKSSENKEQIVKIINEDDYYKDIPEDAYNVVTEYARITEIKDSEKIKTANGGYDMCKGLQEWGEDLRREGIAEGREQGIEQGIKQGINEGQTMLLLAMLKDGKVTIEEALNYTELTRKELEEMVENKDRKWRI